MHNDFVTVGRGAGRGRAVRTESMSSPLSPHRGASLGKRHFGGGLKAEQGLRGQHGAGPGAPRSPSAQGG